MGSSLTHLRQKNKRGLLFCFVGQLDKATSFEDLDVDQVIALLTQWRLGGLMDEQ